MDNFEMLRNADVCACEANELADLRNISLNSKTPCSRRKSDFTAQVGNPYLFRVGETVVKVAFGGEKDFSEILTDVISSG